MSNVVPLGSNPIFNENIPPEIERTIVSFLPFREIIRGARTCHRWQSLIPRIYKDVYAHRLCGSAFYKKAYGVDITDRYDPDNVPFEFVVRVVRDFHKLGGADPSINILPILCVIPKTVTMPDGSVLPFNLRTQEQFSQHPQEGYRRTKYDYVSTHKHDGHESMVEAIDKESVQEPYLAGLAIAQEPFNPKRGRELFADDQCPALPAVTIIRNLYVKTGKMPFDHVATNEHGKWECYLSLTEKIHWGRLHGRAIVNMRLPFKERMLPPSKEMPSAQIDISQNHQDLQRTVALQGGVIKFSLPETPHHPESSR